MFQSTDRPGMVALAFSRDDPYPSRTRSIAVAKAKLTRQLINEEKSIGELGDTLNVHSATICQLSAMPV